MIRIGYACINTRLPAPNRTCRLKNATPDRIIALAVENLERLQKILEWNAAQGIEVFRLSSDIIPLASHPINTTPWRDILRLQLDSIGKLIRTSGCRVSMHPGQFTVLNSPNRAVVESSGKELAYHCAFLDTLGLDDTHKIVIHLGGAYGDKRESLRRFVINAALLSDRIKRRLAIENDERCYSIADVLEASSALGLPVVFDVFHHRWNPALSQRSLRDIIQTAAKTWRKSDGRAKIHYSNQWPGRPPGSHSKSISVMKFKSFYRDVRGLELDIMLEVKDKEKSALKVMRALGLSRKRDRI
jgi:UV DNA damage endonuclease